MIKTNAIQTPALDVLTERMRKWAQELGFSRLGITDTDLRPHDRFLQNWTDAGLHADMDYMVKHGEKRWRPELLVEGTRRVISVQMDYLTPADNPRAALQDINRAYIARYTLGRDYHKLMRKRLTQLAAKIDAELAGYQYRAFVDSGPVLERALGQKAGLGWIGKNTMLMHRKSGSFFLLGEIYTDAPLPVDPPYEQEHCGRCRACLDICPTQAFVDAHILDARKCISYLTIEHKGPIPEELRRPIGNRVFGCDDCQLVCPWNRFSRTSDEPDFQPRHGLDNSTLAELFLWSETEFLQRTEGSAIRRTGYEGWLRNLAVGLGNAPSTIPVIEALRQRQDHPSELVREHVRWALAQHGQAGSGL